MLQIRWDSNKAADIVIANISLALEIFKLFVMSDIISIQ